MNHLLVDGVEWVCPDCSQPLWRTKNDEGFALLCVGPAAFTPEAVATRRAALVKHGTEATATAHERRLQMAAVGATGCGRVVVKSEMEAIKNAARSR